MERDEKRSVLGPRRSRRYADDRASRWWNPWSAPPTRQAYEDSITAAEKSAAAPILTALAGRHTAPGVGADTGGDVAGDTCWWGTRSEVGVDRYHRHDDNRTIPLGTLPRYEKPACNWDGAPRDRHELPESEVGQWEMYDDGRTSRMPHEERARFQCHSWKHRPSEGGDDSLVLHQHREPAFASPSPDPRTGS